MHQTSAQGPTVASQLTLGKNQCPQKDSYPLPGQTSLVSSPFPSYSCCSSHSDPLNPSGFPGLLLVLFTTCQALPAPHIHMNDFLTSCRSLLRGHLLNKAFARPLNKHFNAPNSFYNLFLPDVFFSYLPISNVVCLKYIKTMRVGFSFSVLFNARSLRTRTLPKFNE